MRTMLENENIKAEYIECELLIEFDLQTYLKCSMSPV